MKTQRPDRKRKLHSGHFAFMRAVAQGLDATSVWDRYLRIEGEHVDERKVKSAIAWIRAEFAAAARREKKPGTARLVLIDASQLRNPDDRPTLDVFAVASGLEDFPLDEQLAHYKETYGNDDAGHKRRSRLVQRQLQALHWLEALVAQAPAPGDALAAWLAPSLAMRLEKFGILTLFAMAERINGMGAGWYTGIQGIGVAKAARLVDWMTIHQASIGVPIGAHATRRRSELQPGELEAVVPSSTALVPLEKLVVPAQLDGSSGAYRLPRARCQIAANTDHAAIHTWLASKRSGTDGGPSTTQLAYRKEAERLLLWAVLERSKPLSSLTTEDAQAYAAFLVAPPSSWCGPRHHQRWSPLWRPLQGPLSPASRAQALTIIKNLFEFLNAQRYVDGNPFSGVARPRVPARSIGWSRTLTVAQIELLRAPTTETAALDVSALRAQFALEWLYSTGLRRAEMAQGKCGDLSRVEFLTEEGSAATCWIQVVVGKGQKQREVAVPDDVVAQLAKRLERFGHDPDPLALSNVDVPILARQHGAQLLPVPAGRLYKDLKRLFERTADGVAVSDESAAARLRSASTHWMRHSHASHLVNARPGYAGQQLTVAREILGHASVKTTAGYVNTEQNQVIRAMREFWQAHEIRAGFSS